MKDIRRATRKHNSAEGNTWVVLEGLRGEYSMAALCRLELIAWSLQHSWSKGFLDAGKKRDTARAATSGEVTDLRREVRDMKVLVADLTLENRLFKKSMVADGGDEE